MVKLIRLISLFMNIDVEIFTCNSCISSAVDFNSIFGSFWWQVISWSVGLARGGTRIFGLLLVVSVSGNKTCLFVAVQFNFEPFRDSSSDVSSVWLATTFKI